MVFLEYFAVASDSITGLPAKDHSEKVKAYADFASKIWAAVLLAPGSSDL